VKDSIVVRGARQHNLKGFDLEIPRRTVTVVTASNGLAVRFAERPAAITTATVRRDGSDGGGVT